MTIEVVGPAYCAALAAIHAAAFTDDAWNAAAFQTQLEMHRVLGLMDKRGGLLLLRVVGEEAEILTLGVLPAMRRRGIARALLDAGRRQAAELGARAVYLEVGMSNGAARRLYAGAGFYDVGRRRAYYANGEDALILRADLPPAETGPSGRVERNPWPRLAST